MPDAAAPNEPASSTGPLVPLAIISYLACAICISVAVLDYSAIREFDDCFGRANGVTFAPDMDARQGCLNVQHDYVGYFLFRPALSLAMLALVFLLLGLGLHSVARRLRTR